ncbi:amiloride-sensitive sodium channel subunit beta-like [Haliotis rufescens]|uniref:amiloride-sensitive sodium channel subunit beta-like n=1 Tax=Haliotis rufescens TaxID=6454 RepID=UPI00201FA837|nr:amiloride-sensitive sodium channel subunit beta-like [Haliotis rufescens]
MCSPFHKCCLKMITGRRVPTSRLLGDFADNTSAHGVRKLHEKGHWLLKVLWLLLLLTATVTILMQEWQLINLYQSNRDYPASEAAHQHLSEVSQPVLHVRLLTATGTVLMQVWQLISLYQSNRDYPHASVAAHQPLSEVSQPVSLVRLLTATGTVLMQVWQLINLYQGRPVTTKTTINTRSLQSPSVTLCNLNPFKYSNIRSNDFAMAALRDISRSLNVSLEQVGNTSQSDAGDVGGGEDYIDDPITSESSFSVNQFLTQISKDFRMDTLLSLEDKTSVRELAQPVSELIVSCNSAGMDCHYSEFSWIFDLDYMTCFQFPAKTSYRSLEVYNAGQLFGLSLILNVDQKEYIPFVTPGAGIRVAIHEFGSQPNLMQKGLTAPPGFETSIGIRPAIRIHQPAPYGNCVANYPHGDIETCQRSCLEDLIEAECRCSRRIDNPNNIEITCTGIESNCIKEVIKKRQEGNHTCEACRISCRQHDYIQRLSMATWPSDHHDMALKAAINANNEKSLGDIDTRKNLVSLNVFFSELTEEIVQEEPAYMWENLLSDIGGQLGLWLVYQPCPCAKFWSSSSS